MLPEGKKGSGQLFGSPRDSQQCSIHNHAEVNNHNQSNHPVVLVAECHEYLLVALSFVNLKSVFYRSNKITSICEANSLVWK